MRTTYAAVPEATQTQRRENRQAQAADHDGVSQRDQKTAVSRLQHAADASDTNRNLGRLQAAADQGARVQAGSAPLQLSADVMQLGRKGGGGRGYKPPKPGGKHSKGTRDAEWRKSLERKKPKKITRERRPERREHAAPAEEQMDQDVELAHVVAPQDHVIIDIFDDDVEELEGDAPRSVQDRVWGKAGRGRTFGDTANTTGAAGGLGGGDVGSGFSMVAGLGVLTTGCTQFYAALDMEVATSEDARERGYTGIMGLSNILSGVAGVESAILALLDQDDQATLIGNISLASMALAELTNLTSQIDGIIVGFQEGKSWLTLAHPIAAMIESAIKVVGCVLAIAVALEPGLIVVIVGTGLGMLHGLLKLFYMCLTRANAQVEPDLENQLE